MNNGDFIALSKGISKWHTKTFRKHSLTSQLLKLEEELKEYEESGSLEELADVYIVLSSLKYRYASKIGDILLSMFIDSMDNMEEVYSAIQDKMTENKTRNFIRKGKIYRHEVKDE